MGCQQLMPCSKAKVQCSRGGSTRDGGQWNGGQGGMGWQSLVPWPKPQTECSRQWDTRYAGRWRGRGHPSLLFARAEAQCSTWVAQVGALNRALNCSSSSIANLSKLCCTSATCCLAFMHCTMECLRTTHQCHGIFFYRRGKSSKVSPQNHLCDVHCNLAQER